MKVFFSGNIEKLQAGILQLKDDLKLTLSPEGFPVQVTLDEHASETLSVAVHKNDAQITAVDKAAFFRALGIFCAHAEEDGFTCTETRCFDKNGIMFDCSRNAVLTVEHMCYLLRKMALMGHSWAMLYTEDTYTVESEPYFGYCRGRYSNEEIRQMDDYAFALGIELVPCIQTLSHLDRFLHWQTNADYIDTPNTLMVSSDAVYDFIERMIVAASEPYRTKRIHIGMDEAWNLGRGKRIDRFGFTPSPKLMEEHLAKVHAILQKHGLKAMMWSDMHFENAGPGGYYGENKVFTKEIIESAPEDIDLVYWDYYHESEASYERMIHQHQLFKSKIVFAGGIWTWSGIAPDYRKSVTVYKAGLAECAKFGIKEVFATAWGDNGGECPQTATLLGLQMYAEYDYGHTTDYDVVSRRFRECVSADADAFLRAGEAHYPYTLPKVETGVLNAAKLLLYEDPLMPLFEADLPKKGIRSHYDTLATALSQDAQKAPEELQPMFSFYAALCRALAVKCDWRDSAADAVRAHDLEKAKALVALAQANEAAIAELADAWRVLWMHTDKPFGFEVADGRLGWLQARFRTAQSRMKDFSEGRLSDIPELSEKKLNFMVRNGLLAAGFTWAPMVSAGLV